MSRLCEQISVLLDMRIKPIIVLGRLQLFAQSDSLSKVVESLSILSLHNVNQSSPARSPSPILCLLERCVFVRLCYRSKLDDK